MPIDLIVTTAGRNALVNATNSGTLPVTVAQIGLSQTGFAADASTVALPDELGRVATITGAVVAADTIHVTLRDESPAAYSLRSFALYLGDGTLFAVYSQAEPILTKTAGSVALLAIDVIFADINAAELTFGDTGFAMPTATTERQGVSELATVAEAQAGIDALRTLTPASAKAAILGWLLAVDGAGSGLDADLLDGQQGSWYANIPARLGYTPLNQAVFTADNVLTMLKLVDGHTSGLDADLLDGREGAEYVRVIASSLTEDGGYRIYADGFKECWGKVTVTQNAQNFKINYPAACAFTAFSNPTISGARPGTDAKDNNPGLAGPPGLTSFTVHYAGDNDLACWWSARGR